MGNNDQPTGTVKIQIDHPRGYGIINQADFDPKVHKLFEEKPAAKAPGAPVGAEGGKGEGKAGHGKAKA